MRSFHAGGCSSGEMDHAQMNGGGGGMDDNVWKMIFFSPASFSLFGVCGGVVQYFPLLLYIYFLRWKINGAHYLTYY